MTANPPERFSKTAAETKKDATARVAAEVKGLGRNQSAAAASAVREVAKPTFVSDLIEQARAVHQP